MTDSPENLFARLEDLETRFAFQDQALTELSQAFADQQRRIDQLERTTRELREQLEIILPSLVVPASEETPPPHY
ncbi:MAG: SlyX family protein [Thiohalomonadaceae bacterium]